MRGEYYALLFLLLKPMKLRILTLILFVFFANLCDAQQRSTKEMAAIASAKLQKGVQHSRRSLSADLTELKSTNTYAIFGNHDGFVIVSRNCAFPPVIGYSSSAYDENNMPSSFKWWLESVNSCMADRIIPTGNLPTSNKSVPSLMKTKWDQFEPYNNLTPTYTKDGQSLHYPTGCLATAMAQVMYYYKHPTKGTGGSAYYVKGKTLPVIVDFSQTNYDWANMQENYSAAYSDAQAEAVATLMYHCGASVQMTYDEIGSGAMISNGCKALRTNFGYPYSMMFLRNYCDGEEWMDMVYSELAAKRPIIYGGDDGAESGHAFILDGYDEDGLVSVNWGWSGYYDGFYDITLLNPARDTYSNNQQMLIVDPEKDVAQLHSSWALGAHLILKQIADNKLSMSCDGFYNFDISFQGDICLIADDGKNIYELIGWEIKDELSFGEGYGIADEEVAIDELPVGKYRVFLASMSSEETTWQPMRAHETVNRSYILEKTASGITLAEGEVPTSINRLPMTKQHSARFFDLQGREVNANTKGLVIRRQGSEVKKVMAK